MSNSGIRVVLCALVFTYDLVTLNDQLSITGCWYLHKRLKSEPMKLFCGQSCFRILVCERKLMCYDVLLMTPPSKCVSFLKELTHYLKERLELMTVFEYCLLPEIWGNNMRRSGYLRLGLNSRKTNQWHRQSSCNTFHNSWTNCTLPLWGLERKKGG